MPQSDFQLMTTVMVQHEPGSRKYMCTKMVTPGSRRTQDKIVICLHCILSKLVSQYSNSLSRAYFLILTGSLISYTHYKKQREREIFTFVKRVHLHPSHSSHTLQLCSQCWHVARINKMQDFAFYLNPSWKIKVEKATGLFYSRYFWQQQKHCSLFRYLNSSLISLQIIYDLESSSIILYDLDDNNCIQKHTHYSE